MTKTQSLKILCITSYQREIRGHWVARDMIVSDTSDVMIVFTAQGSVTPDVNASSSQPQLGTFFILLSEHFCLSGNTKGEKYAAEALKACKHSNIIVRKSRFPCQVHSSIPSWDASIMMINTMKSHHPNHSEDICDADHMLKSAPAALAAANCPMFVTHPFSVMKHYSINK